MPSCLGLYIENNLIKYAKMSRDHDNLRIDSFGIKFYDNINEAINMIVSETYSYKTPISVNISDEKYYYADLFSLLNKKDLEKAVDTEFDYFCNETKKNKKALEYRRLLIPNLENKDKITSLYIYSDKSNIAGKLQTLEKFRVSHIVPLPISIANLNRFIDKRGTLIINIEKNTSLTTLIDGQINKIDLIENGMKEIFDNITMKENSYAKAYEICKNSTIYTLQGRNLQVEENEYMEDIMPVLYKIIEQTKEVLNKNNTDIKEIYITGLATAINNIDLYFQENFPNKRCEILTPFFIDKGNVKLNIKDYIEVNSAISLALQGLNIGTKEVNFKNKGKMDQFNQFLTMDIGDKSNKKNKNRQNEKMPRENFTDKLKDMFRMDFSKSLDNIEKGMIRFSATVLILLIIYTAFTKVLINQINSKEIEVQSFIKDSETKINEISAKSKLVNERTQQYNSLIQKIDESSAKITEGYAKKRAIPNFLTQIMSNIPKEVQLTSISNTTGKTIKIETQSKEYEQLGYFIAKIKNEGILIDVTATSGIRQNEFIKVTIEGNLPY
ncbi:MAG: hypothetical protein Q4G09_01830 [Clostridia bacterium]|nr:hypothetical protein [Clostridia bacterium]